MAVPRMSWPLHNVESEDSNYETGRYYGEEKRDVEVEVTSVHSSESGSEVIGSTDIFDEYGNIRLIPVSQWLDILCMSFGIC